MIINSTGNFTARIYGGKRRNFSDVEIDRASQLRDDEYYDDV